MYHIGGNSYQLIKDHKNAWSFEAFRERYSEVLDRYDYIVGDWGYNQLRLKGFFRENQNKGAKDASISHLHDYLNEYCNFGCAYFIVEKQPVKKGLLGQGSDQDELEEAAQAEAAQDQPMKDPIAEAMAAADPDWKPRQHYHRAGTENRHKMAEERWGDGRGIPADSRPKTSEARGRSDEGREQRSRSGSEHRGSDNRPRHQEKRGHDAAASRRPDQRPGGNREQREAREPREPRDHTGSRPARAGEQSPPREGEKGGGRPRYQDGPRGGRGPQGQGGGETRSNGNGGEHRGNGGEQRGNRGQGPRENREPRETREPRDSRANTDAPREGKPKPHDRNRNRGREPEKAEPRL